MTRSKDEWKALELHPEWIQPTRAAELTNGELIIFPVTRKEMAAKNVDRFKIQLAEILKSEADVRLVPDFHKRWKKRPYFEIPEICEYCREMMKVSPLTLYYLPAEIRAIFVLCLLGPVI